jgi:reactive intermediate/imine deaminase
MPKDSHEIQTGSAPAPIGPYSQAVAWDRLVFCSGQVALDPSTGEMVGGGSVEAEAEQVLRNLQAVLDAAGCAFEDVVRTTIYLADMADFPAVNAVYGRAFSGSEGGPPAPARATVQVAGLPKGARVEVDAIAVRPA